MNWFTKLFSAEPKEPKPRSALALAICEILKQKPTSTTIDSVEVVTLIYDKTKPLADDHEYHARVSLTLHVDYAYLRMEEGVFGMPGYKTESWHIHMPEIPEAVAMRQQLLEDREQGLLQLAVKITQQE